MRRLIAFLLSALLVLSLAGCAQPAETTAPENTETQTESLPSSAELSSSEASTGETAESTETEETAAESSGAEESTEAPSAAESEPASEDASSSEADPSAETPAEAPAETTAPEGSSEETAEEPSESSGEAGTDCVLADAFRFTAPADWEKQEDGSFTAADGSVTISFFTVPLSDKAFTEEITLEGESLGGELAAYFDKISENGLTHAVYDSESADGMLRTDSGLDCRFILLRVSENDEYKGTAILSVYGLDEENLLVIRFDYGISSGITAEECLEALNQTIERIE